MRLERILLALLLVVSTLSACHEKEVVPQSYLGLEDYGTLRDTLLQLDASIIRGHIASFIREDRDSFLSDHVLHAYYKDSNRFLWIDRIGVAECADSMLFWLADISKMGFSPIRFHIPQIEEDLGKLRDFNLADGENINRLFARLEYYLTKAFLCYASGQSFGFTNPNRLLNNFEVEDSDSIHITYARLADLPLKRPNKKFYERAIASITRDSLNAFLTCIQPHDTLYYRLQEMLHGKFVAKEEQARVLCNMERCRWQFTNGDLNKGKHVLVNIPAFRLYAVDGDSVLVMRVGCGKAVTKTPLLFSRISRMDINPQWIIPRSIIEKEVVKHVGNNAYFESRNYFVRHRKTGKKVPIEDVTYSKLMDKDYLVIQEGGAGNSLGRIIFRFDNDFSVYLHDTSQPAVFTREDIRVSHGCVRVQKPFELAVFLLENKDEKLIDRIHYSMAADVSGIDVSGIGVSGIGVRQRRYSSESSSHSVDTLDHSRLISSYKLNKEVPIYIAYYTLYPEPDGKIRQYSDIYGYDKIINKHLTPYI